MRKIVLLLFIIMFLFGCAYSTDYHGGAESGQESAATLADDPALLKESAAVPVDDPVPLKESTPLNIEVGHGEDGVVTQQDVNKAGLAAGLCVENEDRFMDWEGTPYTVTFTPGAVKIEPLAFYKCGNMVGMTMPDSMNELEILIGSLNLTYISVAPENEVYKDIDGVVFTKSGDTLVLYPIGRPSEPYIIPDGTITIGWDAFGASNLTEAIIPDSVTEISSSAFFGCGDLSKIVIPDGVTAINDYTFNNCTALAEIILPNSLNEIGLEAFQGCTGLTTVTIPSGVTRFGDRAFFGCENLSSVWFIGANSFDFGDKEDESAFEGCSDDLVVYCPEGDESWDKIEREGIPFVSEILRYHDAAP